MCNLKKHKNELIYESERRTSLVAQTVKRLPTMWETWVQSLGWEDLLEKEMVTHSSILAWKIPWMVAETEHKTVVSLLIAVLHEISFS